ncbi:MAG: glycoside hydrolase family 99-like domain-containing protein, partial [Bacteroidota bacterium]
ELNQKNEKLNQKDIQLIQTNEELNKKNEELNQIVASRSWQITKPLRALFEILRNFFAILILKKIVWYSSKFIFHLLPFSGRARERLKKLFFLKFHDIYNTIKAGEIGSVIEHDTTNIEISLRENINRIIQRIEYKENITIPEMPVKVLAFYLPQFHAIPENDAWWGEGFTEWTNVKPAQPQFEGHYQPHVPGKLGYYNLLDTKVQERQVELAKNYGIGGFCFHYYWFNGKRLLEKPIENYLLNPQLDLPFCISWANENWTRRWDGRENEILIKQYHSPEDDLAFIQHVSKYMFDNRYIRINNKPLLMVYRPGLLPSAKETAKNWRDWCRANGIGEIYLAYVQSFENPHPSEIGYDAAIEFPPNSFNSLMVTHLIKPYNNNFRCNVFDWNTMVMNSEPYSVPDFKLFRGVCPSWDNTPRRKSDSHIFVNSHPDDFQKWVYNAAKDTITRFENPDERLIFVNAWNEWAEGAHLEPDEKYGYAYLQNIYDVLRKLANTKKNILSKNNV